MQNLAPTRAARALRASLAALAGACALAAGTLAHAAT
ncbi:hypothetical protein B1M_21093, partial [Burkholderia sp. TJI49]